MVRNSRTDKGQLIAAAMMRQVSRRSAFRVFGAAGGAVTAAFLSGGLLGKNGRALAAAMSGVTPHRVIVCPGGAVGPCACGSSACITGGKKCSCLCSQPCTCEPQYVQALCAWLIVSENCFFTCTCETC
jgi:hypothetical protein